MIRSVIADFLNRHKFLQYVIGIFWCMVTLVYCVFYTLDVARVLSILQYNDNIAEKELELNLLKEVDSYKQNADGSYDVQLSNLYKRQIDVKYDELIYSLKYEGEDWYRLDFGDGSSIFANETDLVIEDVRYGIDDTVADVYLTKDGFKVDWGSHSDCYDGLASVSVLLETEDGCRLSVNGGYSINDTGLQVNFCRVLPTDRLYYDEEAFSYIVNVGSDFQWSFIESSNIVLVLCTSVLLCICLLCGWRKMFIVLSGNWVLGLTILSSILLLVCLLFTLILL